jgi:hypothetical protein
VSTSLVDPVQVLSWTLDLVGSIELDSHLAEEAPGQGGDDLDREALRELVELAVGRFDRLEGSLRRRLRDLPQGRSKLWSGERLFTLLQRTGVLDRRKGKPVVVAAQEACDAYSLVTLNLLDRIRGEARSLRYEIGPRMAALGEAAARLEGFDALLGRARQRFTSGLHARLTPEIAREYATRLELAVRDLPAEPDVEDIAAWGAPDAWVARLHGDVSRLVLAVLDRERATLLGLLEAVGDQEATATEESAEVVGSAPADASASEGREPE